MGVFFYSASGVSNRIAERLVNHNEAGKRMDCPMNQVSVRDYTGRIIGYLESGPSGSVDAHDNDGRLIGRYDAGTDSTEDTEGRIVMKGNKASLLIGMF